jgi:hypothetical protein
VCIGDKMLLFIWSTTAFPAPGLRLQHCFHAMASAGGNTSWLLVGAMIFGWSTAALAILEARH